MVCAMPITETTMNFLFCGTADVGIVYYVVESYIYQLKPRQRLRMLFC